LEYIGIMGSLPEYNASRADEVADLLDAVKALIHPFIASADEAHQSLKSPAARSSKASSALVNYHTPQSLTETLQLSLPTSPGGRNALLSAIKQTFDFSVNTWHPGFLSKLYAATHPPGLIAELVLATLNTNVHVYSGSPVLTVVEKKVSKQLASMFFGDGNPRMGGVTQPGGSASNLTAMLTARNTLFPETKTDGYGGRKFVVFTSEHGHYSIEKAASMMGLGSNAVKTIKVDEHGSIIPSDLERRIKEARDLGEVPFYVNATAGTTVLGSYDPFTEIGKICQSEGLWMHVDGSWGGSVVFSTRLSSTRLPGIAEFADSVTMNPHKMLGVPVTCSFLLVRDLTKLHAANTLKAGYLFHGGEEDEEVWDLADLTPQCGRKGDSLKMYLTWIYYGSDGFAKLVEGAFDVANHLFKIVSESGQFEVVSREPVPCLQVCFYWAGAGGKASDEGKVNDGITKTVASKLIARGWMLDYAPGPKGLFFRIVVNIQSTKETVDRLVEDIGAAANSI
jgi:glutamate decarboxylase